MGVSRPPEASIGLDIRYVVTSLPGTAEYLYETVYCARGQAENLIKLHKAQLASDRTSCRNPKANQFRLILHTAAYWLLHTLRAAAPKRSAAAKGPPAFGSGCRRRVRTRASSNCSPAALRRPDHKRRGAGAAIRTLCRNLQRLPAKTTYQRRT